LLADLRDHGTDPLAEELYGKEQIDVTVRRKHPDVFSAWLSLSRAVQTEEVSEYLVNQAGNQNATIAQFTHEWTLEKLYEKLRPAKASDWERELFSSDLRMILEFLQVKPNSSGGNHCD
jgi:hypothetical protein